MDSNINHEITIIIVLYEEEFSLIKKCLKNISNFKIIIIDNAGNKKLKKKIENEFIIFKYILNNKNIGYSRGINQGINLSSTEYILAYQADCVMALNDIKILFKKYKNYNNCFLVSPTHYDKNSNLSYNGGAFFEKNLEQKVINLEGDICVDKILTSVCLFKKKDFIDIGLFDDNFFIYFVDDDFCRRISKLNKSVIQIFSSKAQHVHGHLKTKNFIKKIFLRNYHYTYDELYYYFKVNNHQKIYNKLKSKIISYFFKIFLNFLLLRFDKSTFYFSKILAFLKFTKLLNKNKQHKFAK